MNVASRHDDKGLTQISWKLSGRLAVWLLGLSLLAATVASFAQAPSNPLSLPAKDWAVEAAKYEIEIIQYNSPFLRYRIHTVGPKGDQIRDVIESKDGTVARLIRKEDRALTPEEDKAEHDRLQDMIDSPAAFTKHIHGDVTGKKTAADLVKLMPEAMTWTYTPNQPQRAERTATEVVIDYKPDPKWTPPNTTAEALTGLQGRLWVDPKTHRMMRLEGTVFQGVNFGWGILAHIYPGGELSLDQSQVGEQRWIFSHFVEHVTIRALMLKTIRENTDIKATQFQVIEPMSYQDAIHLLLSTPLPK